jgi:hypothetical protein
MPKIHLLEHHNYHQKALMTQHPYGWNPIRLKRH